MSFLKRLLNTAKNDVVAPFERGVQADARALQGIARHIALGNGETGTSPFSPTASLSQTARLQAGYGDQNVGPTADNTGKTTIFDQPGGISFGNGPAAYQNNIKPTPSLPLIPYNNMIQGFPSYDDSPDGQHYVDFPGATPDSPVNEVLFQDLINRRKGDVELNPSGLNPNSTSYPFANIIPLKNPTHRKLSTQVKRSLI